MDDKHWTNIGQTGRDQLRELALWKIDRQMAVVDSLNSKSQFATSISLAFVAILIAIALPARLEQTTSTVVMETIVGLLVVIQLALTVWQNWLHNWEAGPDSKELVRSTRADNSPENEDRFDKAVSATLIHQEEKNKPHLHNKSVALTYQLVITLVLFFAVVGYGVVAATENETIVKASITEPTVVPTAKVEPEISETAIVPKSTPQPDDSPS